MTTQLKTNTSLVEQFREDPEKVKRTIQDLLNRRYTQISDEYQYQVSTKEDLEKEIDLYKSLFTWDTDFEIGGRYQLPYSVNVDLKCKSEKDFIDILKDGYEGTLEPQKYEGDKNAPSIQYEEADLLCGDFHELEPEVRVENLAIKEGN